MNGSLTATNSGQIDFNNIDTTITNPYSSGNFSNIGILTINSTSYSDQSGIISGSGIACAGKEKAPIRIEPSTSSSAPTHSADVGALWVTSDGVLYICTGTTNWSKVGAQ